MTKINLKDTLCLGRGSQGEVYLYEIFTKKLAVKCFKTKES